MMNNILDCQQISFQFSHKLLFSNISFEIPDSSSLCLRGENGSGKTTLLKILAGLLKPTYGKVFCFKEEIWPNKKCSFEHKSIYMSYEPAFYENLTVIQNINFYLGCYAETVLISEIQSALDHVKILNKFLTPVRELSSGQKRRLTFAVLLLLRPKLIFIDEPTNGLDELGKSTCFETFEILKKNEKSTFIIASHDKNIIDWSQFSLTLNNYKQDSQNSHLKNPPLFMSSIEI